MSGVPLRHRRSRPWVTLQSLIGQIALAAVYAATVQASCDVLPSPPLAFRSVLGSTDRPFAGPGDWVTLVLDPGCHGPSPGFTGGSAAHVVSVVFRTASGRSNAVVLADDCAALEPQRLACVGHPGLDSIACVPARHRISDGAGGFIEIPDIEKLDARQLRFRFPDTELQLGTSDDGLSFAGRAAIAVTARGAPLPCDLAAGRCSQQGGTLACVDDIFADDGSCSTTPDTVFPSFTALPAPNDYEAICEPDPPPSTSPCDGTVDEIRLTVDAGGNLLIPVDWRGVLFRKDLVPVLRLVRATSTVEAYPGRGAPIRIPSLDVLKSFSLGGKPLPPLFDPLRDPDASGPVTFFGSADAPQTVLRIARHQVVLGQCLDGRDAGLPCLVDAQCPDGKCGEPRCVGGDRAGEACRAGADCPGGECGPGLFDFGTRAALGGGPVVVRKGTCLGGSNALVACIDDAACPGGQCASFRLAALDPVPLDGLQQSEAVNAFVLEEALENKDLNGDGDAVDHVVRLGDRMTGLTHAIGDAGAEGRAVVRIQEPPFSFPGLAVEGDVLAFLEPEPLQGARDQNGDGDVADTLLRVFRLDGTEVTGDQPPIVADGLPAVNGRPVVVSGGQVFFRTAEAARARQTTQRLAVAFDGGPPNGASYVPASTVSANARYVAFQSEASNLVPDDTNGVRDIFVRDRLLGVTTRVSVNSQAEQANGASENVHISADGQMVVFTSSASNLGPFGSGALDAYVHDLVSGRTEFVGTDERGTPANDFTSAGGLSRDGRFVAFTSAATNLVPGDTHGYFNMYVKDRATGRLTLESVSSTGARGNDDSFGGHLSADGRFAVFSGFADNLVPGDSNGTATTTDDATDPGLDVFVRDRVAGVTERASLDSTGRQGLGPSHDEVISADGRHVFFDSRAALVPGDTNGVWDVFQWDRVTRTTTRVSVDSAGRQVRPRIRNPAGGMTAPATSADGRWVAFQSDTVDLVADDTNGTTPDFFLHDTVTQLTQLVSVDAVGQQGPLEVIFPASISADGRYVVGNATAPLFPGDPSNFLQPFIHGPDPTDCASDLTGDCDLADTMLQVLDTGTRALRTLCPASQVVVAGTNAAFLRPVSAGDAPGCPPLPAGPDDDEVVHLWDGSEMYDLGRAATWVGMSDSWVAALVSEAGRGGGILNGDGDTADTVVAVHAANDPAAAWIDLGQAADGADIAGRYIAFLTPERAQGNRSLNGDADAGDRVLQVYDADAATPVRNTAQAAEEFVASSTGLVAFRTREPSQGDGGSDLNGDGDKSDGVLQVYDARAGQLLNSGQAVTPCRLEACDPRLPYRVRDDTVTFLTFEADQGEDLNRDGDQGDLVLQVLNVRQACHQGTAQGACHALAATTAGVCTRTGAACVTDVECGGGACFVPPGGCLRNVGTPCAPQAGGADCGIGQICQPLVGRQGQGVCEALEGPCQTDGDCTAGAACNLDGSAFNRIASPLLETGGGLVFAGAGRCLEHLGRDCTVTTDCDAGAFCNGGACQREHGSCTTDADCPPGTGCANEIALQTAADSDGDELPDAVDNCPGLENIMQEDADGDGRGDLCDAETCGNGRRELAEVCDGADAAACPDGCGADCRCAAPPPVCASVLAASVVTLSDGPRRRGRVDARLRLPLGHYGGEAVVVRLEDEAGLVATQEVGALASVGRAGRRWRFRTRSPGLKLVSLRRARSGEGTFVLRVKGRRWFDGGRGRGARLTVMIGDRCFVAVRGRTGR